VFDPSAAPAIDGLVIVADNKRDSPVTGQQPQPGILNRVGVLKLIHEKVLKAPAVVIEQLGIVAPEFMGAQQ